MSATGTLGARLFTSATPLVDVDAAVDTIAEFQGLTVATECGLVENFGEFGRRFELATFISVAEGRTRKFKASYNDGSMALTFGADLSDAGQALLKAYADGSNQNDYPFKITISGAPASLDTVYFGAKVMTYSFQLGAANAIVRAMVQLEVNTTIFIGAT